MAPYCKKSNDNNKYIKGEIILSMYTSRTVEDVLVLRHVGYKAPIVKRFDFVWHILSATSAGVRTVK